MKNKSTTATEKIQLHPRNVHRQRYDFPALIAAVPELARFVREDSINFADPNAVKMLNKALLQHLYQIKAWDIPPGYLCPPIPGRVDYLHYLADLIGANAQRVLDIGVGANCVYPLLGQRIYGWQFVGSDIDEQALENAQKIVAANAMKIELRLQKNAQAIFNGIIQADDQFDAVMCNPPFHFSLKEAQQGTQRKWQNLGKNTHQPNTLNFGGQGAELWCPGGEVAFIKRMIIESVRYGGQCRWFTALVSKAENLPALQSIFKQMGIRHTKVIAMAQGQKQSRFVAWTLQDIA